MPFPTSDETSIDAICEKPAQLPEDGKPQRKGAVRNYDSSLSGKEQYERTKLAEHEGHVEIPDRESQESTFYMF